MFHLCLVVHLNWFSDAVALCASKRIHDITAGKGNSDGDTEKMDMAVVVDLQLRKVVKLRLMGVEWPGWFLSNGSNDSFSSVVMVISSDSWNVLPLYHC